MPSFPNYYRDAFDPTRHRVRQLAQEDKYFFAQDLNEGFSAERHARRSVADAIFRDGEVIRGASILVNPENGETILEAGTVYVQGMPRSLAAAEMEIPTEGEVLVGVIIETRIDTSVESSDLIFQNFDTLAFESHGMPRQPWLQEVPRWGSSEEALTDSSTVSYSFFPVYTVRDGVVVDTTPPTEVGLFTALVERYDRESNGHYIVRGLKLSYLSTASNAQNFSLSEGVVNVLGRKIDRPASVRLIYVEDPDLERIDAEPHLFDDGGSGTKIITLNRTPIATVHDISVLTEKTVTVTRGMSTGGRDALPDSQVQTIVEVKQGGTTYAATTSYVRLGDEVDWSPGGAEPSPGSTYTVKYRYKKSIDPDAVTATTVTVSGAVTGSEVDIDYSWKMPRFDVVAIDRDNQVQRIKGVSSPYNPQPPRVPDSMLELARIEQRWTSGYPIVRDTGIQTVTTSDIDLIREAVIDNRQELARIRLQSDASARNPAAINGIFVDNFDNDAQRDAGVAQTASVVAGELTLSIVATLEPIIAGGTGWTLNYTLEDVIVQPLRTGGFKINPYQAFNPIPAQVTLVPAVDQWVEVDTQWASPITETLRGFGTQTTNERLVSTRSTAAQFLRERSVGFIIAGFGTGELLQTLTFDGINVLPGSPLSANSSGVVTGSFDVPANIPAGAKTVRAVGAGGSAGQATYIGRGTITIEERRMVTSVFDNIAIWPVDPIFQSFLPQEGFHLGGWTFRFTSIGNTANPVIVQLREAVQGQPGTIVRGEAVINMATATTTTDTTALFPNLPWCEPGVEQTVVFLTDDANHSIAVAELGKYDQINQRWVTAQPYQVGVFGSSSNNRAWTYHQEIDMYFRAKRAKITSTTRTITLGTIAAEDVTDILALAGVDIPEAATGVELIFERENGDQIRVAPGAVVSLDEALTEDLIVKAVLKGVENASPILFANPLIVLGALNSTDDYVSRAFPCGTDMTVRVEIEAHITGSATVTPQMKASGGGWTAMTLDSTEDVGEGWHKYTYELESFTTATTAIKLTLAGSALNRPRVRSLVVLPLDI